MLLRADKEVPISLCDTRRLRLGEVLGPTRSKGQSEREWELVPSREPRNFMLLRFVRLSHSKTNPNVSFPRSKL